MRLWRRGSAATQRWVDPALRHEVLAGLRAAQKVLPPKLFYDDRGARLFERICEQPEYYLTRAELEILRDYAAEIAACAGPRCAVIEYGSGAGVKVRLLLEALDRPVSYVPVDLSRRQLVSVAAELRQAYPGVTIQPVCADYTKPFELPAMPAHERRVAFFPGSTIGNCHPTQAVAFLRHVRRAIGSSGVLVLGVDRRKDAAVLNAAYNDAAGVTADFNLNLLVRLNRELAATFDLRQFRHRAFFNERASRVEMHIDSLVGQTVHVAGEPVPFDAGESIWTESSYKYDVESLRGLAGSAGFHIARLMSDRAERFWVAWLTPSLRGPGRS